MLIKTTNAYSYAVSSLHLRCAQACSHTSSCRGKEFTMSLHQAECRHLLSDQNHDAQQKEGDIAAWCRELLNGLLPARMCVSRSPTL